MTGSSIFHRIELTKELLTQNTSGPTTRSWRIKGRFLKGPIPWGWLCRASQLSHKSLRVAIGLWFISGMTKSDTVKMQKRVLTELGVSRHSYYRSLRKMEDEGLVSVMREPGQTPLVTLLVGESSDEALRNNPDLQIVS